MALVDLITKPISSVASLGLDPLRKVLGREADQTASRQVAIAGDEIKLSAKARRAAATSTGKGAGATLKINPVLLVPGITSAPITLDLIKKDLQDLGYSEFGSMNYFPGLSDIDGYAKRLKVEFDRLKQNSPTGKVDIVAHSMGGLVSRRMIQMFGLENEVDHLTMIGTPNHGVVWSKLPIAKYLPQDLSVVEMKPDSPLIKKLNAGDETPGPIKYTTIRGGLDEVVIPHSSTPLEGAHNVEIPWGMHNEMLIDPMARGQVVASLAN